MFHVKQYVVIIRIRTLIYTAGNPVYDVCSAGVILNRYMSEDFITESKANMRGITPTPL